jgi:hypothetical protein
MGKQLQQSLSVHPPKVGFLVREKYYYFPISIFQDFSNFLVKTSRFDFKEEFQKKNPSFR